MLAANGGVNSVLSTGTTRIAQLDPATWNSLPTTYCLLVFKTCRNYCLVMKIFLDREGGSQNATLLVVVVVVVVFVLVTSSLKIPKAFLIRSGAQRNFACTFLLTFPTDLPSRIFKLISN